MNIGWSEIVFLILGLAVLAVVLVLAVASGVIVARRWLRTTGD